MREQQQPRHDKAIKAMCNLGWLVVLGKDSRGNYVTQPTADGADVHEILTEQQCYVSFGSYLRRLGQQLVNLDQVARIGVNFYLKFELKGYGRLLNDLSCKVDQSTPMHVK